MYLETEWPMVMKKRKTAYFIDDDQDFLEALQAVIEHPSFTIETYFADNGYKAIDEAIRRKPDVLFIDFNLPRANGGQILPVLKAVKSLRKVPVYFITGHSKDEVLPLLGHLKYDGIIQKTDQFPSEVTQILNSLSPVESR